MGIEDLKIWNLWIIIYYDYFQKYYKMIAIHLHKQQTFYVHPKAVQQINFTGNLENQWAIFLIIEKAKEAVLDFVQGTVKLF